MAQKSVKQSEVKTFTVNFDGGLNLHKSPSSIAENQQVSCRNFYYADKGKLLYTRPGVKIISGVKIGEVLLTVILHPAQGGWRVVGDTDWLDSGVSISLPVGVSYTVEYQDVDGYRTPSGSTVTLTQDTVIDAYYRAIYSLIINLGLPDEVINPAVTVEGVAALADSTRAQRKFKAVSDEYDISYEHVLGYVSPDDESYNLTADTTLGRNYYKNIIVPGFSAMAYGNGVYVGVRADTCALGVTCGAVYTSQNGVTWTKSYSLGAPTTQYLTSDTYVAFGSGIFVLSGKTGDRHIVATSTDGVSWTERLTIASGTQKYSRDVIFCNGLFFTSGANFGGIWVSANGIDWNKYSYYQGIRNVKYFGGTYYAALVGSGYIKSNDVSNWTETRGDIPGSGVIFDFEVYDGRIFTAARLPDLNLSKFYYSTDGADWEVMPCNLDFIETRRFIRTPNAWFMNCLLPGATATTPTLFRSTDLQSWSVVPTNYSAADSSWAFQSGGDTGFYYLNGRLFISDSIGNSTLIIEDV